MINKNADIFGMLESEDEKNLCPTCKREIFKNKGNGALWLADYAMAGLHACYSMAGEKFKDIEDPIYLMTKLRNIYERFAVYKTFKEFEEAFWEELRNDPERELTA